MYFSTGGIVTIIAGIAAAGIGYGVYTKWSMNETETDNAHDKSEPIVTDVVCESAQEASAQADAIVVDIVNAFRIDRLLKEISRIDRNKEGAEEEIRLMKSEIQKILTSNRGGIKGRHGFIGEISQVHISNIKDFINGDEPLYILLDDNSMTDYTRGMQIIQQKACQSGGHLGLDAIKRHKIKYPEFIEEGGIYQIPKDMFEKYRYLKNLSEKEAMKLRKEELRLWKYIRTYTEENPDVKIEPMEVTYSDIQAGNIEKTIKEIENETENEFNKQKKAAQQEHAPNFEEFLKTCGISAAIEAGIAAGTEFLYKLKSGKKLSEFNKQDFKDIGVKFVMGGGKGAFRGGILYIATNIYKIPAAVISGIVTALFGICREGYLLFKKQQTKKQFAKNSSFVILESTASTIGAYIGKNIFKKHPAIGALIGSIFGSASTGIFRRTVFA